MSLFARSFSPPVPAVPTPAEAHALACLGFRADGIPPSDIERLARSTGLTIGQVGYWLRELPRRERLRAAVPPFVELKPMTDAQPLAVVLPGGLRVEVPPHFEPAHLRAVVGALTC